jgi:DNA mismatch repair ATPase MutS
VNSYYSQLLKEEDYPIVKNSYKLNNNLILTGPKAAGKTTLLKSTIFNIIMCQQMGCGFFDNANIRIYDYIHCYINIPDTSNRDSLFQAEARRCKDIEKNINENKDKINFCVFDELYSGTNPNDAIKSAYSYLKYLNNNNNVKYILTTHYNKLCKKYFKR